MKAESDNLRDIAQRMVTRGKGILAADESSGTIEKRFAAVGVESSPQKRREYREALFAAEEAVKTHISGVILFEETLRQHTEEGTPLVDLITSQKAIAGIKVDKGLTPLEDSENSRETRTRGLEGLSDRLWDYREKGCAFAKWRAIFTIDDGMPSRRALQANADGLATYARRCQTVGLVPIVEPEVLMEGGHDITRCASATAAALRAVFEALEQEGVALEAVVLKPNMVTPGDKCRARASASEIAAQTLACLRENVPAEVAGIAFLSGGQGDKEATENLNAINVLAKSEGAPWPLTFSFGRALQAEALRAWSGDSANIPAAQAAFTHRARMNALACVGEWTAELE